MTVEIGQVTKQVIDFQKGVFSSWYDVVAMVQDQSASAMETILNQAGLMPEEGRKTISSWLNTCQQERSRFKSYVDAGFSNLEKLTKKQSGK